MVSTERVIAYGEDIASEAPFETEPSIKKPSSSWPSSGKIELSDLSYRHSKSYPLVLRGITAVIASGEKVRLSGCTCVSLWVSWYSLLLIIMSTH